MRSYEAILCCWLHSLTFSQAIHLQEGLQDGGENRLMLMVSIQGSTVITCCGLMEDVLAFFSSCPSHPAVSCGAIAPLLRRDTVEGQVSQHYANHRKIIT